MLSALLFKIKDYTQALPVVQKLFGATADAGSLMGQPLLTPAEDLIQNVLALRFVQYFMV